MDDFSENFINGMRDCQSGKPHESDKGEDYDRGYGCQYEREALECEMSRQQGAAQCQ